MGNSDNYLICGKIFILRVRNGANSCNAAVKYIVNLNS